VKQIQPPQPVRRPVPGKGSISFALLVCLNIRWPMGIVLTCIADSVDDEQATLSIKGSGICLRPPSADEELISFVIPVPCPSLFRRWGLATAFGNVMEPSLEGKPHATVDLVEAAH
jgi:hypothetical protein